MQPGSSQKPESRPGSLLLQGALRPSPVPWILYPVLLSPHPQPPGWPKPQPGWTAVVASRPGLRPPPEASLHPSCTCSQRDRMESKPDHMSVQLFNPLPTFYCCCLKLLSLATWPSCSAPLLPPHLLLFYSSHLCLEQHGRSHLRTFAHVTPSAWNTPPCAASLSHPSSVLGESLLTRPLRREGS